MDPKAVESCTRIPARNHPGGSILAAIMAQFLTAIDIHSANRRKLGRVKAQAKADSRACQIDQSRLA